MWTENVTQAMTIAADGIHSASQSTAEKLTAAVDIAKFRKVVFVIDNGTLGSSGTLDFQVKAATTSGGSYTAVTGTAITQLVKASNDNQYEFVEVAADKLQNLLGAGYRFLKGSLLPGTAAANSAVIALGFISPHEPTSGNKDAVLNQTVVLP